MIEYYRSEYQLSPPGGPSKKNSWWRYFKIRRKNRSVGVVRQPLTRKLTDNPFIKKSDRRRGSGRLRIGLSALLVITAFWGWFLLHGSYFQITEITYLGLELIKRDEIETRIKGILTRRWPLPGDNYFMVNISGITKEIEKNFSVKTIKVSKRFPDTLIIDLEEKNSAIIYDNGQEYFLMDREGVIIKDLGRTENPEKNINGVINTDETLAEKFTTSTTNSQNPQPAKTHTPEYRRLKSELGNYPIIYDTRNIVVNASSTDIFPLNFIAFAADLPSELAEQGIMVKYMVSEHPLAGLEIYSNEPWRAKFQPEQNMEQQIKNLFAVLAEHKVNEYIDLRFIDRIYWK